MNTPSLDDVRLFVAIVQSGSLTKAAELTGVPISRLSRRLSELENALGTQLVNRGKRGVSLNELGELFFAHAQTMLTHADIAINSIQHSLDKPVGRLKVSVPVDISHCLVMPKLDEYLHQYPDVSLEISLTQQKINMIQDGIDVAIRAGNVDNDHVVAKVLTLMTCGIFATQDYLNQHGTPQTPHDLYQHRIIAQTLTLPWQFSKDQQNIKVSPSVYVGCNDFVLVEDMINKGLGLGLLVEHKDRRYQHLVRVLDDWQLPSSQLSVIYYKNRGSIPTVRSFVQWLCEYFQ